MIKKFVCALSLVFIFFFGKGQVVAQSTQSFGIESSYTKASYEIEVIYPTDFDSTKSYSIVYCLDWLAYEGLITNTYGLLEFSNLVEPLVLVGISNGGGWGTYFADRARDFTPVNLPEFDVQVEQVNGNSGITGGGGNFLLFLQHELLPKMGTMIKEKRQGRGIIGYSYGGLFATYALTNEPELFQKYLIGSPSLWFGDFSLTKELKEKGSDKIATGTSIHLSVGEMEGGIQLRGFGDLNDTIKNIGKEVSLKSEIVQDEGHSTAVVVSYLKGIRFLYQK